MKNKKDERYIGFDIMKSLCTFFVVCIHCLDYGRVGEYFLTLAQIAVPIFFMITGFFYSGVVERKREFKQIRKMLTLAIWASILYFIWFVIKALVANKGVLDALASKITWIAIFKWFFFNETLFGYHLWYLFAILYVLFVLLIFGKIKLTKILMIVFPVLLVGDVILGTYSRVLLGIEFPNILLRNFLFMGIPYFCIGILISKKHSSFPVWRLAFFTVLFSITSLLEKYILDCKDLHPVRGHYVSTTFLAIVVFLFFKEWYKEKRITRVESCLSKIGKEYSMGIYIIHPIVIDVLYPIVEHLEIYEFYRYISPVAVCLFSVAVVYFAKKVKGLAIK